MLVLTLGLFILARLALYSIYFDESFSDLGLDEVFLSFLLGIRFDLSVAVTFLSLPILGLALPFKVLQRKGLQNFWIMFWYAVTALFCLFLIGDVLYFKQVKRHVFDELSLLGNDLQMLPAMALGPNLSLTFGFFVAVIACSYLWKRCFGVSKPLVPLSWWQSLLVIALAVLAVRGSLSAKPLSVVDAFTLENPHSGQLILNGAFSAWHGFHQSRPVKLNLISEAKMSEGVGRLGHDLNSPEPFSCDLDQKKPSWNLNDGLSPNIVFILLESFGSFYVDSFGKNDLKATPNFDRLTAEGLSFTNFFANGTRSIEAIQTVLTSFPPLKGIPTIGHGFELMNTAKMGHMARANHYTSIFAQSSPRRSFRLDSVASAMGFDEYYGKEDYKVLLDYSKAEGEEPLFGWDYESLLYLLGRLNTVKQPFISFYFSGTSHSPFVKTPVMLDEANHDAESEVGFLNTLFYTDWSLGEFFKEAKKQPWFDNTIFVLTADHTLQAYRKYSFEEKFRVPLVLYAPKLIKPGLSHRFGSHVDLLPTIAHLTGWKTAGKACVGRSMLVDAADSYALILGRFESPAIITAKGYLQHSLARREASKALNDCDALCVEQMEADLLGINQYLYTKLRANSWMR